MGASMVVLALLLVACGREDPDHAERLLTPAAQAASGRADGADGAASARATGYASAALDRERLDIDPADNALLAQWHQAQRDEANRLVARLLARGDAASLLDAALLMPLTGCDADDCGALFARRAQAIVQAGRLAPDHALIAFLESAFCQGGMAGCDLEAAMQRLARLDPDNAAAHANLLDAAWRANDPAGVDRALAAAAHARTYELYFPELLALTENAHRALPAPSERVRSALAAELGVHGTLSDDEVRRVSSAGVVSAMALPAMQGVTQACSVAEVARVPARRGGCLALLARMAESDTTIARAVALVQLVRLTHDTPPSAHWREQLRRYAWVRESSVRFLGDLRPEDLRVQAEQGEWMFLLALLRRHGVPVVPPPGWQPADARHRALIDTGQDLPRG